MTLELYTSIGIDLRTSRVRYEQFFSRSIFSMVLILVFEFLFIRCNRFREPMIDLHAPYTIQGMGTK